MNVHGAYSFCPTPSCVSQVVWEMVGPLATYMAVHACFEPMHGAYTLPPMPFSKRQS